MEIPEQIIIKTEEKLYMKRRYRNALPAVIHTYIQIHMSIRLYERVENDEHAEAQYSHIVK